MEISLKISSCPFCGAEAVKTVKKKDTDVIVFPFVINHTDGCFFPVTRTYLRGKEIDRWNHRNNF
jgi:hypothetical protein